MSARADLCGGRSAMIVPTATSSTTDHDERFVASTSHCSGWCSCKSSIAWAAPPDDDFRFATVQDLPLRRRFTAAANSRKSISVSGQSIQASVMLCP